MFFGNPYGRSLEEILKDQCNNDVEYKGTIPKKDVGDWNSGNMKMEIRDSTEDLQLVTVEDSRVNLIKEHFSEIEKSGQKAEAKHTSNIALKNSSKEKDDFPFQLNKISKNQILELLFESNIGNI